MTEITRETATYDPDLPHAFRAPQGGDTCQLCGEPRKDELHQVEQPRQRASAGILERELGS